MNKYQAVQLLIQYLSQYDMEFVFHSEFINEIKELLSKNLAGQEKKFFNLMIKQLGFVQTMGKRVHEVNGNERLSNINFEIDLYSLHLNNNVFNIRFLIAFLPNDNPIFLAAFYERAGKKRTNYDSKIGVAKNRYLDFVER